MFHRRHFIAVTISLLFFLFLAMAGGLQYALTSRAFAEFLFKKVVARYLPDTILTYSDFNGNLQNGISLMDVRVYGVSRFPRGTEMRIRELSISPALDRAPWFTCFVEQGRIKFPVSAPIIFFGHYQRGSISANIYSPNVDLKEVRGILRNFGNDAMEYSGDLDDVDIDLSGFIPSLKVQGTAHLSLLQLPFFTARDVDGKFDMKTDSLKPFLIGGSLSVTGGEVKGKKTATVEIETGRFHFDGRLDQTTIDLRGKSLVMNINIDIFLKGNIRRPDITLSSRPPRPQEQLLIMLATNRTWAGAEKISTSSAIPADLAGDLVDYFLLGGMGSELARTMGITDVSLRLEQNVQGFDIQKQIFKRVSASYGYEQDLAGGDPARATMTQKFGGSLSLDDSTSIGFERSVTQLRFSASPGGERPVLDEKFNFGLKKEF